uniref:Uncharacterized protein n=1 Tax=Panagrolaimus sp. JU765 TaxID=591449 RepID=A0AC34RTJ2_9BILA
MSNRSGSGRGGRRRGSVTSQVSSSSGPSIPEYARIPAVMAPKKDPGIATTVPITVTTNIHGVKVPNDLIVYRNDVTVQADFIKRNQSGEEATVIVDLTKKTRSDAVLTDRKDLCRVAFAEVVNANDGTLGDEYSQCYDLQSTLFTKKHVFEDGEDVVERDLHNNVFKERFPNARNRL